MTMPKARRRSWRRLFATFLGVWLGAACAATPSPELPVPTWQQGAYQISLSPHYFGSSKQGRMPVLVLLDGELYAGESRKIASDLFASGQIDRLLLVLVEVPAPGEQSRLARLRLLTTAVAQADLPERARSEGAATGEIGIFGARLQLEVAKLARAARADPDCITLFGHSLAGHGALAIALEQPDRWRGIVAASPSLWWGRKVLLRDRRLAVAPAGRRPNLLLTVGALESAGDGSKLFQIDENVAAFAMAAKARFRSVEMVRFPGEGHQSSVGPAIREAMLRAGRCWHQGKPLTGAMGR